MVVFTISNPQSTIENRKIPMVDRGLEIVNTTMGDQKNTPESVGTTSHGYFRASAIDTLVTVAPRAARAYVRTKNYRIESCYRVQVEHHHFIVPL